MPNNHNDLNSVLNALDRNEDLIAPNSVFKNLDEYHLALRDPRYQAEQSYRDRIDAKLARSTHLLQTGPEASPTPSGSRPEFMRVLINMDSGESHVDDFSKSPEQLRAEAAAASPSQPMGVQRVTFNSDTGRFQ